VETRARTNELALMTFLSTVVMLFAAFTAAYLIRRTGADWHRVPMPGILVINTFVLLASSVTIECARRTKRSLWLTATTLLGLVFQAGQFFAWRSLAADGIFLPTHPHSAFLYMLTAVHGVHLLGGIGALAYVTTRKSGISLCATYWHFVDAVWLYLFLMLSVL